MGKTLAEIEQMPERHLQEYELFYQQQPFGLWREDYRSAQLAHLLAVINSDPKKSSPELNDFMPFWQENKKSADDESDDGSAEYLAGR